MSVDNEAEEPPAEMVFVAETYESSEDPPMEKWSSLIFNVSNPNAKKILYEEGEYHPGSGELCGKYIRMSDSSVLRHPYYNYPCLQDPGIEKALLGPESPIIYADDGQELYLAECKAMGQCPVKLFYKGLLDENVDLRYYGINPYGIRAMCLALERNKLVRSLNLTDNFLNRDASYHLSTLLMENSVITDLNLSGCRIGAEGTNQLMHGLLKNKTLHILNLDRNNLGDRGVEYVADAVFRGLDVKNLSLSHNNIGAKGIAYFTTAFETHNKFESLNFSWNNLYTVGATYNFLVMLGDSKNILDVDLSWNSLAGPRLGTGLSMLLKAPNLRSLILSNNNFEGEAIAKIMLMITKAKKLMTLDLSYNPLTPQDALSLLKKMKLPRAKIQFLNLDHILVNHDFVGLLESIKRLKFRQNFELKYGGVAASYVPVGPDIRELLFNRAEYLGKKSKKKFVDIAQVTMQFVKNGVNYMNTKDFAEAYKATGAPWDADLLEAFGDAFPGPRSGKSKTVNLNTMLEYIHRKWPDRKLPVTPPPEEEPLPPSPPPPAKKKKKGKKGKK